MEPTTRSGQGGICGNLTSRRNGHRWITHLVQGSVSVGVPGVDLRALGEQQQHHREVPETAGEVERGVPDPARDAQTGIRPEIVPEKRGWGGL